MSAATAPTIDRKAYRKELAWRVATATAPATTTETQAETAALAAWTEFKTKAEPLGLTFGQRLYELRKDISAQGRDGEGLCAWLHKAGIPRRTAYYWIAQYETSIGIKQKDISQVEAPKTKSVFEDLITTLYSLTSSGNDGVEHKFITLIENAVAHLATQSVLDEGAKSSRQTVIYLLNRLSKEFHEHAAALENAGIVQ